MKHGTEGSIMPVAIWNDSFATGNIVVDEQHKQLFLMVNKLNDAILAGQGKEQTLKVLDSLARYIIVHFQDEEKLMLDRKYPEYTKHKSIHDNLTQQATQIISKYKNGEITLTLQLSQFLGDWIKIHIMQEDQKMASWIKANS